MTVGERIREERKKVGISQRELAQQAGLSNSYVALIETGKTKPSLKSITQIAEALKIDRAFLVGEDTVESVKKSVRAEIEKEYLLVSDPMERIIVDLFRETSPELKLTTLLFLTTLHTVSSKLPSEKRPETTERIADMIGGLYREIVIPLL